MTEPCQARRHASEPPCGRVHRPNSTIAGIHAAMVARQQEREGRYRRKVGTEADWCGHALGARYIRGGVTDTWPCRRCGVGFEGTRHDDGGGPVRVGCCRGEDCR
jgi:hypothetical protein